MNCCHQRPARQRVFGCGGRFGSRSRRRTTKLGLAQALGAGNAQRGDRVGAASMVTLQNGRSSASDLQSGTLPSCFRSALRGQLPASPQQLPLSSDSEVARAFINTWVEGVAHRKIFVLLPVGSVTADTRLALVNALYFKALWIDAFREAATRDADFSSFGGEPTKVPTMHASGSSRYADVDLVQVLELPYEGASSRWVLSSPRGRTSLPRSNACATPRRVDDDACRRSRRGRLAPLQGGSGKLFICCLVT